MKKKGKTSVEFLQTTCKNKKMGNAQSANQQTASGKKYSIRLSGQYKRSLKRCMRRGCNERQLTFVIDMLASGGMLPLKYHKHPLGGLYKGCWECHIADDWLLIWKQNNKKMAIILTDIGRHSELFDKQRR